MSYNDQGGTTMTPTARHEPATQQEQRYRLACTLVFKERKRRRASAEAFADLLGVSKSTLSKIENAKPVGDGLWEEVTLVLEWGPFLEFVKRGDATGAGNPKFGNVDPELRDYAVYQLHEIGSPSNDHPKR